MIKNLALDLNGVILKEGHIIKNILVPLLGGIMPYREVKNLYEDLKKNKLEDDFFWKSIDPKFDKNIFFKSLYLDEGFDDLKKLKSAYRMGIISNLPSLWARELESRYNLTKDFSPIIISSDVGLDKPELKIYQLYLDKICLRPEEVLFIDDKKEMLIPARSLGIKTIWMRRKEDNIDFIPDFTVKNLKELTKLLKDNAGKF